MPVEGHLPLVEVEGALAGDRLREATARAAATIAGAAPALLRRRVEQIEKRPELGLVAELREGPELIFGDGARARAKWAAAARVLADPEARGASYIDLRIPSRPAAGGLPAATVAPVAPAGLTPPATTTAPPAGGATAEPGTTVDPAAAAPTDPATGVPESSTPVSHAPPPDPLTGGAEGGAVAPTTPYNLDLRHCQVSTMLEGLDARFVARTVDTFRRTPPTVRSLRFRETLDDRLSSGR